MESFNFISALGYVGYVAGAATILFSKIKTDNLNDLKERVGILEKELQFTQVEREKERQSLKQELSTEIKTRQELHLENQKAISNLEGQLATYKEIPLRDIANSLKALPEIQASNISILGVLQDDAKIAKADADKGGMYVKTKKSSPLTVEVKE